MKGKFITVEGTDGAGKSTQIDLLVEYIKQMGIEVIVSREPGGTDISEEIRDIILDVKNGEMSDTTEALLYAASRAQHVEQKIRPALERGAIVICDRFVDSSIVYQGYARGLDIDMIEGINKYAVCGVEPDVTLFFDVRPEVGISRKESYKTLDRIESEKIDFHYKVYNGYKALSKKYPERIKRIDAEKDIEDVHRQVVDIVKSIF